MSKGHQFQVLLSVALLSVAAILVMVLAVPVHAAPTITQVHSQVAVLQDGRLQVRYRLTFEDDASRTQITTIGPFDPGHS